MDATKRLLLLLLTPVLALLKVLSGAVPAAAGDRAIYPFVCGKIYNASGTYSLLVTGDYSDKDPRTYVGTYTHAPYRDDDGFYVPAGYNARGGTAARPTASAG